MSELRVEELLGKEVFDVNGRKAGHLEEIRVSKENGRYFVDEWLIGSGAILERLSGSVLKVMGWSAQRRGHIARWNQLDLSDPHHPRLTCRFEDLETLAQDQAQLEETGK